MENYKLKAKFKKYYLISFKIKDQQFQSQNDGSVEKQKKIEIKF